MEYPTMNDFYLKLKVLYDRNGNFTDYVLVYISNNFYSATNINPELILGKRISEIVVNYNDLLGLNDYYFNIIPNSKSKNYLYIKELKRWYMISMFTDESDNGRSHIIFYNDVSDIKKNSHFSKIEHKNENIYHLKDGEIIYYRDRLTGLYNKLFFDEEISRLDTKRQLPISIITLSINGLKLINDAFGRDVGDKFLIKTSEILTNTLRQEDIISRLSGEEFLILLPKTSEETALSITERIRNSCMKNPLDQITISLSMGVSTKNSECEDMSELLKKSEEKMYLHKISESKAAKEYIINLLRDKLEKITFETKSHYDRLKELSMLIADKINLSDAEKEELKLLCEFHDIGKIGISKNILQKNGTLDKKEWEDIKSHSQIGYYIIKEIKGSLAIDDLILLHHERWDGKGYPGLFKGEQIPLIVRIFAIADAFEAMVNERPYKNRITIKEALHEIKEKSGKQFDPILAEVFIKLMDEKEQIV